MEAKANDFLEKQPIGELMRRYAVPCVISLLVAALYNIVDQLFIANASYLGSHGNAANTVVFPLTDKALLVRRLSISANRLLTEAAAPKEPGLEHLDLFTDYAAQEKQKEADRAALERERKKQEAVLPSRKSTGKMPF